MLHKAWNSKGEMPYCFPRSSIKFQGHTVQNITDFDPNWAFLDYRPVAAFKSLRFALFFIIHMLSPVISQLPNFQFNKIHDIDPTYILHFIYQFVYKYKHILEHHYNVAVTDKFNFDCKMYLVGNTKTDVQFCLCIGCLYETVLSSTG